MEDTVYLLIGHSSYNDERTVLVAESKEVAQEWGKALRDAIHQSAQALHGVRLYEQLGFTFETVEFTIAEYRVFREAGPLEEFWETDVPVS